MASGSMSGFASSTRVASHDGAAERYASGLPATDPIRYGVAPLMDAVDAFIEQMPPKE